MREPNKKYKTFFTSTLSVRTNRITFLEIKRRKILVSFNFAHISFRLGKENRISANKRKPLAG